MFGRLNRHCFALTIISVMSLACGDDPASNEDPVTTTGSGGAVAGGGRGAGTSGNGAAAGRGTGFWGGQMCPMTEAEATGACTPARGTCMFGTRVCDCSAETNMWACWAPEECPTSLPAERSTCSVVGMSCGLMGGADCDCTAAGWDCGRQYCPPEEPAAGGECERAQGVCTYGERTCDCEGTAWVCWTPATDCPATPPLDDAACTINGAICEYEGGGCECDAESGWDCDRGVDNNPDDAGVPPGTDTPSAGTGVPAAGAGAAGVGAAGAGGLTGAGTGAAGSTAAAGTSGSDAAGTSGSAGTPAP
jgi:hypothetical protein